MTNTALMRSLRCILARLSKGQIGFLVEVWRTNRIHEEKCFQVTSYSHLL